MKKVVYAICSSGSDGSEEFIQVYENLSEAAWKYFSGCSFTLGRFDTLIYFAQEKGRAMISGMQIHELIQLEIEINDGSDIGDIFYLLNENWDKYYPQGMVLSRFEIGE